jgi:DNA phosphorothioation-associated putative methyltransferase
MIPADADDRNFSMTAFCPLWPVIAPRAESILRDYTFLADFSDGGQPVATPREYNTIGWWTNPPPQRRSIASCPLRYAVQQQAGRAKRQIRRRIAGKADAVDGACQQSPIGKLLSNALYVHASALDELEPLLRIHEGCARAYLGEIDGANLIKLHRFSGKVSYLVYPSFEADPHPALRRRVKLAMRTRELECYGYTASENPPILHRKEMFLAADHPLYEKFARLTKQEERHGLFDETATIGTRAGWESRLAESGFRLAGHRLMRRRNP